MDKINKKLFDPNLWALSNGLLVPKWTIQRKPKSDLEKDILTYSTFNELFPNERNSHALIKKEYGEFWLNDIVETLAKINYIVFFTQYQKTTKEDFSIALHFLKETAVFNYLESKEIRKIITRQQMLANIRLAFLYASKTQTKKLVLGNEKDFGKLIYRVTDYLENRTRFKDEKNPTEKEKQQLYLSLARNLFFNEPSNFALAMSRYWYIFNKVAYRGRNKKARIKQLFKSATKTNYNHLLAVGFAIWGFYCETNKNQRLSKPKEYLFSDNYFKNTKKKVRQKLSRALDIITGDYDYYKREFANIKTSGENFYLNPFWKKPILKNSHGVYCALDIKFLEERLTEGAYWMIFDYLLSKKANKKTLSLFGGQWGYIFEDYINELVKSTFPKKPLRLLFENDGDKTGGVDIIIIYPDTLFFIEVTTKKVRYDHWINNDYSKIEKSFYRIFIKDDNSNGRVVKLYKAIQMIKERKVLIDGCDISNIRKYIPIVLFEKSPPMHRRLWHIYDSFLQKNGIIDREFLDDLEFWDTEELEMVLADVQRGKSMPEILKEKEETGFFKDSIKNFYVIYRKHFDKHSMLNKLFEEMTKGFTKTLFKQKKHSK
jgi:hypothetical protein